MRKAILNEIVTVLGGQSRNENIVIRISDVIGANYASPAARPNLGFYLGNGSLHAFSERMLLEASLMERSIIEHEERISLIPDESWKLYGRLIIVNDQPANRTLRQST